MLNVPITNQRQHTLCLLNWSIIVGSAFPEARASKHGSSIFNNRSGGFMRFRNNTLAASQFDEI